MGTILNLMGQSDNSFIMLMDSVVQEFGKDTLGLACLCSTILRFLKDASLSYGIIARTLSYADTQKVFAICGLNLAHQI